MSHQSHPEHLLRELLRLFGGLRNFDAATLPSASGMYLSLYDDSAAEPFGRLSGFILCINDLTAGNANTETGENLLGLVLVDLHR
jgi:hypothetical protein